MNPAAFVLFTIAGASIVSGLGFLIAVDEEVGAVVLLGGGVAALVAGLGIVLTQGRDVVLPDAGREATSLPPSVPAAWPFALALGVLVAASGMATRNELVWVGVISMAVAGAGWFAQSWSQHPTWTDEQHERVTNRLVLPLALPLGVTGLVAVLAIAFSRALLAASVNGSVLLALVAALVILGAGTLVALKGLGRSAVLGLLTTGALVTAALGVGGAVAGEREFHHKGEGGEHAAEGDGEHAEEGGGDHSEDDGGGAAGAASEGASEVPEGQEPTEGEPAATAPRSVELVADDLAFDKDSLTLPADQPNTIEMVNEENLPHNVAIKTQEGDLVFRPDGGGIITGPGKSVEYDVPPLKQGEYIFFCEVHPAQMQGDLTVA
jgi:plastocyanin